MTSYCKLKLFCLASLLATLCYSLTLGATPFDQKPEFLGDFYFVDEAEQKSPPLRLLSTKMELFVPETGKRGYSEYLTVRYKVLNESQRDTFKLALIGENLSIYVRGRTSFSRSYVKQVGLPAEIRERLDKYFDIYHDSTTLPINVFELKVAPNASTTIEVYYRNSRDQFANHYDDVCIFNFWTNPAFGGDIEMNFEIASSLDTSVIDTPKIESFSSSERVRFSHEFSRPAVSNNVISLRFPFIPEIKEVRPSFSEMFSGFLSLIDNAFPRSSLFGLGIIVGLALMAVSRGLIKFFGNVSRTIKISRTAKTNCD